MSSQNPVFIPGPTNIPERLRHAVNVPTIDHRSSSFGAIFKPLFPGVKRVLTSHRFVEQGKLHDLIDALEPLANMTYLEEVREKVGLADKLFAAAAGAFPKRFRVASKPSDPGVILFTSGSFGAPRGVILSQANLIANVEQVAAHIPLDPSWVMFNPLPMHSKRVQM